MNPRNVNDDIYGIWNFNKSPFTSCISFASIFFNFSFALSYRKFLTFYANVILCILRLHINSCNHYHNLHFINFKKILPLSSHSLILLLNSSNQLICFWDYSFYFVVVACLLRNLTLQYVAHFETGFFHSLMGFLHNVQLSLFHSSISVGYISLYK